MGCKEKSFRTASRAGIASASCIWPKANAASCANKFEESFVAKKEGERNEYQILMQTKEIKRTT